MKKTKKMTAKIVSIVALLAIVLSIVGTGLLVIFSSPGNNVSQEITSQQLEEPINSASGSVEVSQ